MMELAILHPPSISSLRHGTKALKIFVACRRTITAVSFTRLETERRASPLGMEKLFATGCVTGAA